MKHLYKGTFNWQGQSITLYTHARNTIQAFSNFCRQLSKEVEYNYNYVWQYFMSNEKDNYLINKKEERND